MSDICIFDRTEATSVRELVLKLNMQNECLVKELKDAKDEVNNSKDDLKTVKIELASLQSTVNTYISESDKKSQVHSEMLTQQNIHYESSFEMLTYWSTGILLILSLVGVIFLIQLKQHKKTVWDEIGEEIKKEALNKIETDEAVTDRFSKFFDDNAGKTLIASLKIAVVNELSLKRESGIVNNVDVEVFQQTFSNKLPNSKD